MRLDAVRPGTLLYGQFPDGLVGKIGAQQGLTLRDPWHGQDARDGRANRWLKGAEFRLRLRVDGNARIEAGDSGHRLG